MWLWMWLIITLYILYCIFQCAGELEKINNKEIINNNGVAVVEIVSWNWKIDSDFGTKGVIKWNVEIKNNTDKYLNYVRVELTTYDSSGRIVCSTGTYVNNISPYGKGSDSSYADYYRTEKRANIKIVSYGLAK